MTTQADKQHYINEMARILKIDTNTAEAYLESEEWDIYVAIESYRADQRGMASEAQRK